MADSTIIFRRSEVRSQFLVVINKGPGAVTFPREGTAWDLMEIYFKPEDIAAVTANPAVTDAEHVVFETDRSRRKFAIVKTIFQANAWLKTYDAILLADDDVEPVGCSVAAIFELFMTTGCRIGQPALTTDSYYAHFLTLRNEHFVWRRVNYVDFMCLLITPEAIEDYLPIMDENVSGFGVDRYWGFHEWKRGPAHAILDATPMRHSRPVGGGEAHQLLSGPQGQYEEFMQRHQLPDYPLLCLDGVVSGEPDKEAVRLGSSLTGYPPNLLADPKFLHYAAQEVSAVRFRKPDRQLQLDDIAFPNRIAVEIGLHSADFRIADLRSLEFETEEFRSVAALLNNVDLTKGPVRLLVLAEGKPPILRISFGSGSPDPWSDCAERYFHVGAGVTVTGFDAHHFRPLRGKLDPTALRQLSIGGFGGGAPGFVRLWCQLPDGSAPDFRP